MSQKNYLLLITRADLPAEVAESPIYALVYAPGLPCMRCDQPLTCAYLIHTGQRSSEPAGLFGADGCLPNYDVKPWKNLSKRAAPYGPCWPLDETSLPRQQRKLARGLALLVQLEANNRFAAAMFQRVRDGQALIGEQATAVTRMLDERGGLPQLLKHRDWLFRLEQLERYPLTTDQRKAVADFQAWVRRRRGNLTSKQQRFVYALEMAHLKARLAAAENLALSLCAGLTDKFFWDEDWIIWGEEGPPDVS